MEAGDNIKVSSGAWRFSGSAAENFDSHVSKSVPMYDEAHNIIVSLSDFFTRDSSIVVDIGSSTGTLLSKIASVMDGKKNLNMLGIDPVSDMATISSNRFSELDLNSISVDFFCGSYMDKEFENESISMISSVYTLQFVHPSIRQAFINKVYQELEWGGAFILFEKIRADDARFQDIFTTLYNEYKINNGYSCDEIISKTLSLKGVLEPFSTSGNYGLLQRAGFQDIQNVFQYLCFQGILAIK
tara:strand:- start:304 stop:1032 length:729 start_codon:yes stop_codon:yes gene_type:complete